MWRKCLLKLYLKKSKFLIIYFRFSLYSYEEKLWSLIDLVNWISSKRKGNRNFGTSNWWPHFFPKTCFEGPLVDVLRTSWGCPESSQDSGDETSQESPLKVKLECPQDGQVGSLGDVVGTVGRDVLRTSWGPIFGSWENKSEKKQKIQDIFININYQKFSFSIIRLEEISKVYLEDWLLIMFYVIKHLTLLKI